VQGFSHEYSRIITNHSYSPKSKEKSSKYDCSLGPSDLNLMLFFPFVTIRVNSWLDNLVKFDFFVPIDQPACYSY
jgi:Cys-tRNA synthase (O-phospho-L-seryl-tRNA:Cys-tRNA synthase)